MKMPCPRSWNAMKGLSSRFATGEFPGSVKFVAVIKEVAPVAGAATDAELGVEQFEVKYLGSNNPIYMDINKEFYKALGSKSLLSQPLHTWNPFRLYSDFRSMSQRLSEAKAEGNLKGEGITQGGIFIVSKEKGVVYQYNEKTGFELPYAEIKAALESALQK